MTDQLSTSPLSFKSKAQTPRIEERIKNNDSSEVVQFLSSLSLFSSLPTSEIESLSHSCRFATLAPREYITIEGDEDPEGFIVASGRLAMMKTSLNGKELIVELLEPGDLFGLLISLQKSAAQLSAMAQAKARVLWVPLRGFLTLLNAHPDLYKEAIAHLLDSLQSSYRIARGLAHDRVETRIAAILSSMALKIPRILAKPQDPVINITRQQLADLVGTSTETAIRVTREMQRNGIIAMKRPALIEIIDIKALRLFSDG